jgi:hypothetical protein
MATLTRDTIGVLDIELTQGDDKDLTLVFNTVDLSDNVIPLDLRQYSVIRLDVKSQKDVNEKPFISFTVANGLTIGGTDFNVLTLSFSGQFTQTPAASWYYDIKFTNASGTKHLIEGSISIKKVVTK